MSTASITEPSIETSAASDRLTEALEQKLSHPATTPEVSSRSTDAIRFSQARSASGRWPQSVWPQEASRWLHFGNTPPAKDRISQWTCARHCGVSPDSLKGNGKPLTVGSPPQVAMRLAHS